MSSESDNVWPAGAVLPLALLGPPLLGLLPPQRGVGTAAPPGATALR